ncbi:MAG: SAM-dependent methyltransferase, partial [Oceanihabitans sp.]
VIDFMNSEYVIKNLVAEDIKVVEGIAFKQKRRVENGYIIKDVSFTVANKAYTYQERVRGFTMADFENIFEQAGVYLLDVFGDYKLRKFDTKNSERLIMLFK